MPENIIELTLLSSMIQDLERELRLIRLAVDNIGPKIALIEQSFFGLVSEVSRGFGQMQQQLGCHEARFDAIETGLSSLRTELATSTDRIIGDLRKGDR